MEAAQARAAGAVGVPDPWALVKAGERLLRETGGDLSARVAVRWLGPGRGTGVVAQDTILSGKELLTKAATADSVVSSEIPLPGEEPAFTDFFASVEQEPGTGGPGSGRLVLRLTLLLLNLRRSLSEPLTALEQCIAAYPTTADVPAHWPPEALLALRGSVHGPRAEAAAASLREEAAAVLARWPASAGSPPPTSEEFSAAYARSSALVATRAFQSNSALGAVLCPVLDFCNHASAEDANAHYVFTDDAYTLAAVKDIPPGREVCICYSAEGDFLDVWERYGFFDATARVHTAEILAKQPVALEPQAFWIPEQSSPLECPLLDELREAAEASLGQSASEAEVEREALSQLAALIREHLAGYPPEPDAAGAGAPEAEGVEGAPDEATRHLRAARAVIAYEKRLLRGTLARVEAILVAGPSEQ